MLLITKTQRTKMIQNAKATREAVQAGNPEPDHAPVLKLFHGGATWLFAEGELERENFRMFGLADLGLGNPELGYAKLEDMAEAFRRTGKTLERDMYFKATHPLSVYARAAKTKRRITEDTGDLNAAAATDDDTPERDAAIAAKETKTEKRSRHNPDASPEAKARISAIIKKTKAPKANPAQKETPEPNPVEQKQAGESMAIAQALGRPIVYAAQSGDTVFVAFPATGNRAAVHASYSSLSGAGAEIYQAGYEDFTGSDLDADSLDAIEIAMIETREAMTRADDAPKALPAPATH